MRSQVVASPLFKLLEKVAGPVGVVNFEAVAKNRVRWLCSECLHQTIADVLQIMFCRRLVILIEDESLRADRSSLYLHSCPARNEEENDSGLVGRGGEKSPAVMNDGELGELPGCL